MNEYDIEFMCGQIKFVKDFFGEYQDENVTTSLKSADKMKATFLVSTSLTAEDAVKHVKKVFKESKFGLALHFAVQVIE